MSFAKANGEFDKVVLANAKALQVGTDCLCEIASLTETCPLASELAARALVGIHREVAGAMSRVDPSAHYSAVLAEAERPVDFEDALGQGRR